MNNPFQGRRLFGAGLALLVFAPGAGLAAPIVSSQSLDFSTTGQSLWAPGTDALAGLGFSRTFIDQTVAPTTIGVINGTVQVPNPARPVYDAAASACNALGDVIGPPCVDALGPRPPANITLSQKNGAALTYSGELKFGW